MANCGPNLHGCIWLWIARIMKKQLRDKICLHCPKKTTSHNICCIGHLYKAVPFNSPITKCTPSILTLHFVQPFRTKFRIKVFFFNIALNQIFLYVFIWNVYNTLIGANCCYWHTGEYNLKSVHLIKVHIWLQLLTFPSCFTYINTI